MRVGQNPEKKESRQLVYKKHRIIIPVFIPQSEDHYYKESLDVFKYCLESLIRTIDTDNTAITILNNNSNDEVQCLIESYFDEKLIDKYVKYAENKGKVYAVLQEARASYEEFLTIADADVFFLNNWQSEIQSVFEKFKEVGVVGLTPDPNMAFYCNNSIFSSEYFKIKKGKIVADTDLELFENSIGNADLYVTKKRNWKEEHYYLEKDDIRVVVGANHFASTYRKRIFEKLPFQKPIYIFPGGELNFLDIPIDKLGYHRVSLPKAFAYHMGNTIDQNLDLSILKNDRLIDGKKADVRNPITIVPYFLKEYFVRLIRKCSFI